MHRVLIQQVLLAFSWHSVFPGVSFKSAVAATQQVSSQMLMAVPCRAEDLSPQFAGRPFKGYFEGNKIPGLAWDKAKLHPFPRSRSLSLVLVDGICTCVIFV